MTCTKTGCHIWVDCYNEWMYGDAFEVSPFDTKEAKVVDKINHFLNQSDLGKHVTNLAYFKIVARSFKPINGLTVKHYTVWTYEDLIGGVSDEVEKTYWPPIIMITNQFTNHGYHGVPI